jgi:small subunit ribosomal protein S2
MKEYIFGERNGIHIIDLQKTLRLFKEAVDFLTELGARGKEVLFVGTKRQAQEAIEEDAKSCGMHFVTNRWLGGLLTNFETIQNSIKRYKQLEASERMVFTASFPPRKRSRNLSGSAKS